MPRLSPLCIAWGCAALAMSHTTTLAAPQIWRCPGNSYADRPCEGGHELGASAPAPTTLQRQEADENTRKDQAAAERMQRERRQLEAQQHQRRAVVIGPAPREPFRPATSPVLLKPPKKTKAGKSDDFVASSANPQPGAKKKKKARAPDDAG